MVRPAWPLPRSWWRGVKRCRQGSGGLRPVAVPEGGPGRRPAVGLGVWRGREPFVRSLSPALPVCPCAGSILVWGTVLLAWGRL